jgi:hypothetical protein
VEYRVSLDSIDTIDGEGFAAAAPGDLLGFNLAVGDDDNGGFPWNFFPPNDGSDSFVAWDGSSTEWFFGQEDAWGTLLLQAPLQSIPEPSSIGLAALGLIGLLVIRKRY